LKVLVQVFTLIVMQDRRHCLIPLSSLLIKLLKTTYKLLMVLAPLNLIILLLNFVFLHLKSKHLIHLFLFSLLLI